MVESLFEDKPKIEREEVEDTEEIATTEEVVDEIEYKEKRGKFDPHIAVSKELKTGEFRRDEKIPGRIWLKLKKDVGS